ncbi:MAG TPA: IS481 family transposase [Terriglobia bacterium]
MDEKVRLMVALTVGEDSVSELCADFGVSRKTAYKWWARYRQNGAAGLKERSHAPAVVPWAITGAQAKAIVAMRRAHPSWGPKKLRAILNRDASLQQGWPAPSTIGELLRREQLSQPRKRRRSARPSPQPLRTALSPNDIWCTDFKGPFHTDDGMRCNPLTVSDAYSRYLLCVKAVSKAGYDDCRSELERVFRQYGLPRAIRSDNGPPFASSGVTGLSRLSVWWLKLGIMPERIEPGRPEQNGRHERMHKTLKAECASPPQADRDLQQRRFDQFRHEFNQQRPHEALGQTAPATHYTPSARSYPARLEDPAYPADYQARRVRHNGEIKWQGESVFLTEVLRNEIVGVIETDDGNAEIFFGPLRLGLIDGVSLKIRRPERSTVGRGGQPSSHSSHPESENVLPIMPV